MVITSIHIYIKTENVDLLRASCFNPDITAGKTKVEWPNISIVCNKLDSPLGAAESSSHGAFKFLMLDLLKHNFESFCFKVGQLKPCCILAMGMSP